MNSPTTTTGISAQDSSKERIAQTTLMRLKANRNVMWDIGAHRFQFGVAKDETGQEMVYVSFKASDKNYKKGLYIRVYYNPVSDDYIVQGIVHYNMKTKNVGTFGGVKAGDIHRAIKTITAGDKIATVAFAEKTESPVKKVLSIIEQFAGTSIADQVTDLKGNAITGWMRAVNSDDRDNVAVLDLVKPALESGEIIKAIIEGRIMPNDTILILQAAGLDVPPQISSIAEIENSSIAKHVAKMKEYLDAFHDVPENDFSDNRIIQHLKKSYSPYGVDRVVSFYLQYGYGDAYEKALEIVSSNPNYNTPEKMERGFDEFIQEQKEKADEIRNSLAKWIERGGESMKKLPYYSQQKEDIEAQLYLASVAEKLKEKKYSKGGEIETKVSVNGKPLIMYHGGSYTNGEFKGGWFTVSRADASGYAKRNFGTLTKAIIEIKNPLYAGDVSHLKIPITNDILKSAKKRGLNIDVSHGKIKYIEANSAVLIAQDIGRDGVIALENGEILDVVPFSGKQVKPITKKMETGGNISNLPKELSGKRKFSYLGFGGTDGIAEHTTGHVNLEDLKVLPNGIATAKNTIANDKSFKPSKKPITVGVDVVTGEKQLLDGYHRYVLRGGVGESKANFLPMKDGDIVHFENLYADGGGIITYYNSHGHKALWSEIRETEIERGNYTDADFDEWEKKYGIKPTDKAIWVTPSKRSAYAYMDEASASDKIMAMSEEKLERYAKRKLGDPYEYSSDAGIPESDDGDNGFLFVVKPVGSFAGGGELSGMKQIDEVLGRALRGERPLAHKYRAFIKEDKLGLFHYQHLLLVYDLKEKKADYTWHETPTDKRGLDAALKYLDSSDVKLKLGGAISRNGMVNADEYGKGVDDFNLIGIDVLPTGWRLSESRFLNSYSNGKVKVSIVSLYAGTKQIAVALTPDKQVSHFFIDYCITNNAQEANVIALDMMSGYDSGRYAERIDGYKEWVSDYKNIPIDDLKFATGGDIGIS